MPKIAVATRSFNNARTGVNDQEKTLSAAAVKSRGVKKLYTLETKGDARGCEAQPLIANGVVILATMGNVVYGFDEDTGKEIWVTSLDAPIKGTRAIDAYLINDNWGILSTPVLDLARGLIYLVEWWSTDGTVANAQFSFFALGLADGSFKWKLPLGTATYDPGHGLPVQKFSAAARKQRASLAYDASRDAVYISFGTIAETSKTAQGWVIAVDVTKQAIKGSWTSTARGSGAGIWMAGGGPAIDPATGHVYVVTGNGDFDAITDFGECLCALNWVNGKLTCVDWFSPFTDAGLRGLNPATPPVPKVVTPTLGRPNNAMVSMDMGDMPDMDMTPTAVTPAGEAVDEKGVPALNNTSLSNKNNKLSVSTKLGKDDFAYADDDVTPTNKRDYSALMDPMAMGAGADVDMDLGSGNISLDLNAGVAQAAGKHGIHYRAKLSAMGKTTLNDFANPAGIASNYTRLDCPPIYSTFYGPGRDPTPTDLRTMNFLENSKTHHQHGPVVTWTSEANGDTIYTQGENSVVKAYLTGAGKPMQWVADGPFAASPNCIAPPGGMPGGMMALAANGDEDGILVVCSPYGDANQAVTTGRTVVYDASDFSGGTLKVLWDSQDWGWVYMHAKFVPPVIANGKIYITTYAATVLVLELA